MGVEIIVIGDRRRNARELPARPVSKRGIYHLPSRLGFIYFGTENADM